MSTKAILVTVQLLLYTALAGPDACSQDEQVGWWTFGAGFGKSVSGESSVVTSVGEPMFGTLTGTNTIVRSGFLVNQVLLDAVTSASAGDTPDIPTGFELFQNFPNPFNPSTTILFALPEESRVRLRIFNILGEEVATILDEVREAGFVERVWGGTTASGVQAGSGVYFYMLEATGISTHATYREVKRMMLLK